LITVILFGEKNDTILKLIYTNIDAPGYNGEPQNYEEGPLRFDEGTQGELFQPWS